MAWGTNGLVDVYEVGMRWELGQEGGFAQQTGCYQGMVREERGMLNSKELWLACGPMWFGGEEDAGELAATEDLGE